MILSVGMLAASAGAQASDAPNRVQPHPADTVAIKANTKTPKRAQIGRASWYGRFFQGKKTATGERYNMYEMTAASKTLPLGSYAKVTNLKNQRWVLVRINDRGPYVDGRAIDLSYGAAKALDMAREGVEKVKIEPLTPVTEGDTVAMLDTNSLQ